MIDMYKISYYDTLEERPVVIWISDYIRAIVYTNELSGNPRYLNVKMEG